MVSVASGWVAEGKGRGVCVGLGLKVGVIESLTAIFGAGAQPATKNRIIRAHLFVIFTGSGDIPYKTFFPWLRP